MANSYEGFYDGGDSVFNFDYGNLTGYNMSAAKLGFPGSPQTADQLGDAIKAIKHGTKVFEVEMLQPDIAETIPRQHFAEMRALMKLTGVKPSVHGPMIDAAGFDEKGNWGNGFGREDAERRMFGTMEKAAMLDNEGNVPVVFHSSAGAPGAEFRPGKEEWGEKEAVMQRGAMINRETGVAQAIKREYKFRPGYDTEKSYAVDKSGRLKEIEGAPAGVLFDAEGAVDAANLGDWEEKLMGVAQMSKHAEEIIGSAPLNLGEYEDAVIVGKNKIVDYKTGKELPVFDAEKGQEASFNKMRKAGLFLENAELSFKGAFHQAYKYGDDDQKKALKELSEDYSEKLKASSEIIPLGKKSAGISVWSPVRRHNLLDEFVNKLKHITDPNYGGKVPEIFQESNAFAMSKAAETFGNLAIKSYDKLGGNKAPVLAIEPFHPGSGLASTDDMIKLVKKSRDNFARQLVKDKGLSDSKAKSVAEKKIGVTWDVGHINLIKKHGFTDEDIVEQTKKIAPMVKHVHLTDNFGHADTHLVPGMGNTPIKKILEELEKAGRFDEMKKITEAGAFVQHFKKLPHSMTLAAMGSGIYGMKAGPAWDQAVDMQGAYFGGYGTLNPQTHHSYFGAGFTTMPVELGGMMPGSDSRFGGTPMA